MVKIYTKGGDKGETSLFDGRRVGKDDPLVETYGTVDVLNSTIGVVRSVHSGGGKLGELLHRLQTEGPLTFERVFEARPNRLVMVGLFLALLELIRDKLVWAEQSETSPEIYLRALTDEPAEQAVRKAIISVDEEQAEQPADQTQTPQTPPIPIAELPPKPESPSDDRTSEETHEAAEAPPIPIAELPPKPEPPSGDSETEETHEAAEGPPIPIAELPSRAKSPSGESPSEALPEAEADDDLMFDKP